jgi:hypothetical protein
MADLVLFFKTGCDSLILYLCGGSIVDNNMKICVVNNMKINVVILCIQESLP